MVECEYIAGLTFFERVSRFNRYMVECEYRCLRWVSMVHQVLIDTWWNVN